MTVTAVHKKIYACFFKRALDILLSIAALAILAIPMALLGAVIRLESRGPALFRQRRAGKCGKPFMLLKFRTMRTDVEPYGVSPHSADDPRLTRVGRYCRETSLDELPQLMNVLIGQMSLVGPRPLYERQAAQWNPRQRRRLEVRPGLSGYAQAFGRGAMTIEDKIEFDLHYVDNVSLLLDLKIIFKTLGNMFGRSGKIYEQRYSRDKERETDQ